MCRNHRHHHCHYRLRRYSQPRILLRLLVATIVVMMNSCSLVVEAYTTTLSQVHNTVWLKRSTLSAVADNYREATPAVPPLSEPIICERESEEYTMRFAGIARLYQSSAESQESVEDILERLRTATVIIVGVGGVGSWAAESIGRSGVGNIVLIDLDDVCISNTNRQLCATRSSVGQMKIDVLRERLLDINPSCNVTLIHDFCSAENIHIILDSISRQRVLAIDAIDNGDEKAALIAACADRKIPIVTCGGAAGRKDPTKIQCCDITAANGDKLIAHCRKILRKSYKFPEGLPFRLAKRKKVKKWNVICVYSTEEPKAVPSEMDFTSFRRCDSALGTASFVTGAFGLIAAGKVIDMIATDKLLPPRRT